MSVEQQQAPESWQDALKGVAAEMEAAEPTPSAEPVADPEPTETQETEAEAPAIADTGDQAQAPEPEVAEPAGDAEASEPTAFEPPQHWTRQDKEAFAALDDGAKQFTVDKIKAIEKNARTKMFEADRISKQDSALAKAMEPFADQIARTGSTPEQAISTLAAFYAQLQTDPAAALAQMAQLYASPSAGEGTRRDVAQRVLNAVGLQPDALDEPLSELDPTEAKLTAIERKLEALQSGIQTERVQTQQSTLDVQIQAFAKASDGNGGLAHPHYDALKPNIEHLLKSGDERVDTTGDVQTALGTAYQAALSDLRAQLVPEKPKPAGKPHTTSSVAKSSPAPGSPAREPAASHKEEFANVAREMGLA